MPMHGLEVGQNWFLLAKHERGKHIAILMLVKRGPDNEGSLIM